ncbi:MAG: FAD-dependent monooxygenase [Defluviicoccus sp.]|nr:FAD-dependent monooxygenase [Defluviicoccus sp.]MDE0386273.1 FAD-dependent monooxygenase [Defluviicoccus sp.]
MADRPRVVVVGGGPVGLALAVELGLRGVACEVIERRTEPHRIPKGQNLTQRTLDLFYSWGIADELRSRRVIRPGFPGNAIVAYGDLAGAHWFAGVYRTAVDRYYFQRSERLPQYLTEQVLRDRLAGIPAVRVREGWSAEAVRQSDAGAAVDIAEEAGARRETVEADYVVGCDGSRSAVRDGAGLASGGTDYEQTMVLAVFRSPALGERLKRFPPAYIYRVVHPDLKGYWRFFGRIDEHEGWFFHAPVGRAERSEAGVRALLREAAGFAFDCSFEHIGYWDLRVSIAEAFRAGRVFIAGDAAHSHPPYGGYGLNTGFEDAANLGWKLAAVLQGWGGEALLQSYSEERQEVAASTAAEFIDSRISADRELFERIHPERDAEEFARGWTAYAEAGNRHLNSYAPHYVGSTAIAGPPGGVTGAASARSERARPGHYLPPWRLASGRNVFEELGRGFTLVALGGDDGGIARLERACARRSIPLKVVREPASESRGAGLVLVRPDSYVAWAGDAPPENADALMARVTGAATRPSGPAGRASAPV